MSVRKFSLNRKNTYKVALITLYIFVSVALVIFIVYLAAPLLGGKLSFNALILYGSWICMGLFLIFLVKRAQKGFQIKHHQYLALGLLNCVCMFILRKGYSLF